ncbi:MAG: glycosyltransferase family 4 protein [archaeon]|nr:glycosyltransferase family 4 protein [Candidatus Rehaiarchaeum fermentans]
MKGSVVITRSNPVSPDPRVEKFATALSNCGLRLMIVAWDRKGQFPDEEIKSFGQIYRIKIHGDYGSGVKNLLNVLFWNIALLFALIRNKGKFQIIHACDFDTIIPALICKLLFRKKVVYDVFDFYADMLRKAPDFLRRIIRRVDLFLMKFPDAVILADDSRIEQIKGSKPKRLTIIYNSLPFDFFKDFLDNSQQKHDSFHIAYVGLLQLERGIIPMINVVKKHSKWHLTLAGYGGDEELIKKEVSTTFNIKLLGRIPYEEALKIYANCEVMFATYDPSIPNHRFSSANKLFESMALGKPIIVARDTSMDKIVEKYNLGFVVNYGNEDELEKVLLEISSWDEAKKKEFAINSLNIYKEYFSWEKMEERLRSLYDEILGY